MFKPRAEQHKASEAFIKAKQASAVYPEPSQVQYRGPSMGDGNTVYDRIARDGKVTYNRSQGKVVAVTYEAAKYASRFEPRKLTAEQHLARERHDAKIAADFELAMARWRKA